MTIVLGYGGARRSAVCVLRASDKSKILASVRCVAYSVDRSAALVCVTVYSRMTGVLFVGARALARMCIHVTVSPFAPVCINSASVSVCALLGARCTVCVTSVDLSFACALHRCVRFMTEFYHEMGLKKAQTCEGNVRDAHRPGLMLA